MILFRPEFVAPVLFGAKTQTRRLGKRRWKVGSVHACYTHPPFSRGGAEPFCRVRITDVRRELLFSISPEDALAEGYQDRQAFLDDFRKINDRHVTGPVFNPPVWVVHFETVLHD